MGKSILFAAQVRKCIVNLKAGDPQANSQARAHPQVLAVIKIFNALELVQPGPKKDKPLEIRLNAESRVDAEEACRK